MTVGRVPNWKRENLASPQSNSVHVKPHIGQVSSVLTTRGGVHLQESPFHPIITRRNHHLHFESPHLHTAVAVPFEYYKFAFFLGRLVAGEEQKDTPGRLHSIKLCCQAEVHRSGAVVLPQDQENRGGEEAAAAGERTWCILNPRLGEPAQRLLAVSARWRHSEALPNTPAGRGRLLHRAAHHLPNAAGARRALLEGLGRPLREPLQALRSGNYEEPFCFHVSLDHKRIFATPWCNRRDKMKFLIIPKFFY